MSLRIAALVYRWRLPLSAFILLGALVLAPRADITKIDNDITAWFSKEDPVYKDYERFRQEFGGTRSLIVAIEADRDDRLRGDLVSDDATVTAIVVTFDEDRIDDVRAGVIQRIHDIVDPKLPEGVRAF